MNPEARNCWGVGTRWAILIGLHRRHLLNNLNNTSMVPIKKKKVWGKRISDTIWHFDTLTPQAKLVTNITHSGDGLLLHAVWTDVQIHTKAHKHQPIWAAAVGSRLQQASPITIWCCCLVCLSSLSTDTSLSQTFQAMSPSSFLISFTEIFHMGQRIRLLYYLLY